MKKLLSLTLSFIFCTLVSGCGQKGPLFLPEDAEPTQPQQEQPANNETS